MQEALAIVDSISNDQAISLLDEINRSLFKTIPYEEMKAHLPVEISEVKTLLELDQDAERKRQSVDPENSIKIVKQILAMYAQDDNTAPLLIQTWREIKDDDSLMVFEVITLSLALSSLLFMATTEVEFKVGELKIKKHRADAKTIAALFSPVVELIKKIPALT